MPVDHPDVPPRCCRCGSADSAVWFPLYRFRLSVCGDCYAEALRGAVYVGPFVPAPVPV